MKISKEELQKIINEEVNEIFGFGKKKKSSKEYPAAELATIMRGLASASKMTGIQLTPEQREAVVDELTKILEDEGFAIKENERLFTGEGDVVITSQKAPKLKVFLDAVAKKDPKVFNQLSGLFRRSALDISPVAKSIMPATVSPSPSSTGAPAAAQKSPKSTPAPSTDQKSSKSSEAEDFIRSQFGKKVSLDAIMFFSDDQDIDDNTARKIVKVVRDAGYTLSEAEIREFKKLAGIK